LSEELALRLRRKQQEGFTLLELMVGLTILLAVFGFSFKNLAGLRKGMNRITTSGPHLYFESFAVSRLKLYFAKLMQWNTHLCKDGSTNLSCVCSTASYFAYAPITNNLTSGKANPAVGNMTLGADLRMSLSTFTLKEIAPNGINGPFKTLIDLAAEKRVDSGANPWGALIPFHTVSDEWALANPSSRAWCNNTAAASTGVVGEMCKKFEACAQVAGGLGGARPTNQIGTQAGATPDIKNLDTVSMCFVYAGNMFSRPEFAANNPDEAKRSAGIGSIDYPSVVGLVVAEARFINNSNLQALTCEGAATEMNRSLKIKLTIYSAINADLDVKKQGAQKSIREITGEKMGVPIPNCEAPGRGGFSAVGDETVCIEDPTFIYECKSTCTVK
jgi:prepilin-type N-terminal cleavage/methylation domain-containing protein